MNLQNTLRTPRTHPFSASMNSRESWRTPIVTESSEPIEDLSAALEENMIRFRSNPSYGLKDVITDAEWRSLEGGLVCELKLAFGTMVICISNSKRKLRRMLRKFGRNGRALAQGVVVEVGSAMAKFRKELIDCVRTGHLFLASRPDFQDERRRFKAREGRGRWNAPKNFQPRFA